MKNSKILFAAVSVASLAIAALPLFAGALTGKAGASVTLSAARIAEIKAHADAEIDRRINVLNMLKTRLGDIKHISDSDKSSLSATVGAQISALTAIKTKINADTSVTDLRTDIKSITTSYRIFLLVIPQIRILAAADRIMTTADSMSAISAKLALRIGDAKTAGKNTTAMEAALADMNAKIADAKTQAAAAKARVAPLTPDNGDKTKMNANHDALVAARADIKVGTSDLKTARHDATTITQDLRAIGIKMNGNATSSAKTH